MSSSILKDAKLLHLMFNHNNRFVGSNNFSAQLIKIFLIIKRLAITLKGTATLTITMFYMKDLNKP